MLCLSHIASYEEIPLEMYTRNKGKLIEYIFSVFKINDLEKDSLVPRKQDK